MLSGGVARGYADENSELDLTVFLTPAGFRKWVRHCQAPIPEGDHVVGGIGVDTTLTSIEVEQRRRWEPLQVWDASYAKVLLDRRGRLGALLRTKVRLTDPRWDLHEEAIVADWYVGLGIGWIDRTDVVAGHHLLNLAFDHFLSLLFRAQGEAVPFDKWQFHLSRSLPRLPYGYESMVRGWLSVRRFTAADLRRRARQAEALMSWWRRTFREAWLRSQTRDAIRDLRKGPLPLIDFQGHYGTHVLRSFPLRAVASASREGGLWIVRLDAERLQHVLEQGHEDMPPYLCERLRLAASP